MSAQMEHPVFQEEVIHCCRLVERGGYLPPGCIEIRYIGAEGEQAHVICANAADDFMERYRAAPDDETRQLVMESEIRKAYAA